MYRGMNISQVVLAHSVCSSERWENTWPSTLSNWLYWRFLGIRTMIITTIVRQLQGESHLALVPPSLPPSSLSSFSLPLPPYFSLSLSRPLSPLSCSHPLSLPLSLYLCYSLHSQAYRFGTDIDRVCASTDVASMESSGLHLYLWPFVATYIGVRSYVIW